MNKDGLLVDDDKIKPILDYPRPKNLKQLRGFIGATSWYRKIIKDYAKLSEPLTSLTRKGVSFSWKDRQEEAFQILRTASTTAPILAYPNFRLPFVVQTDASQSGLGAVITQVQNGQERVIAYASRVLSGAERNYSTTEQECLAVVWAIKKFRHYFEGYKYTVITDHSSLRWLYNLKNPTGRLARWALDLLEYDFEVVHRKGAMHHVPDALSRMYENEELDHIAVSEEINDEWYIRRREAVLATPNKFHGWKVVDGKLYKFRNNPLLEDLMDDLQAWELVVPKGKRQAVLREVHERPEAGHLGPEKTYHRASNSYFSPGMFKDVNAYVRKCATRQLNKSEQAQSRGIMGQRIVQQPWTVVATDIMGPFPRSKKGHEYLIVFQALFTKWIELAPLKAANAQTIIASFSDLVITRWGTPQVLHSHNGTEFNNNAIREMAETFGIRHSFTPLYHPQENPVERTNRVFKTMIRPFIGQDHRDWDANISDFRFAYNTSFHSTNKTTPAYLNLGRELFPRKTFRGLVEGEVDMPDPNLSVWTDRMSKMRHLWEVITTHHDQAFIKQAK